MTYTAETMERADNGMFILDEPTMSNDILISAEKKPVKSGGWLATFRAFNGEPKYAAFTTASAAKQWLVEEYNSYATDDRKRLPWKKRSDLEFTAHAEMTARGKINFKKD
jgi:hypothetical protein